MHPIPGSSIQPHPPLPSVVLPLKPLVWIVASPDVEHDSETGTDHGLLGPAVDFTLVVAGCLALRAPRMAIAERSVCSLFVRKPNAGIRINLPQL